MAGCCQATSHYLSQCWPRSMSPYGVTRPQWVNSYSLTGNSNMLLTCNSRLSYLLMALIRALLAGMTFSLACQSCMYQHLYSKNRDNVHVFIWMLISTLISDGSSGTTSAPQYRDLPRIFRRWVELCNCYIMHVFFLFNSLAPGRFDSSLKLAQIFCEIAIRWMPQHLTVH